MAYKNIFKLICLILIYSTNALAGNLFVDPNPTNGHDTSGTGTIGNPYRTLGRAGQDALGGDTIFIRGGTPNGTPHLHIRDVIRRRNPDTGWIYIRPFQNETVILDGSNDLIPEWEGIIRIESSKRISIKGLTIRNNNSQVPGYGGLGIFINSNDSLSRYISIDSCIIYNIRKHGILIQGSNAIVNKCEIYNAVLRNQNGIGCIWDQALSSYVDLDQPGAPSLNKSITFSNNKIHNCWGEGIGIIRTDTFSVKNNEVYNCYSVNIYCDNAYNGEINNNWIYVTDTLYNRRCWIPPSNYSAPANGIFWAAEGAGHYQVDRMVENIKIHNNLIYGTSPAFGWFHDSANTFYNNSYRNIKIYYNTIYNISSYNSFYLEPVTANIAPPTGCEFRNNIIPKGRYRGTVYNYFTESQQYYQTNMWTFSNNCFIDSPIPPNLPSGNNIEGNPSFINPNGNSPNDFKIPLSSNCNNYGITISGLNYDYWYAGRDNTPCIGFHEYGGVAIVTTISNLIPDKFQLFQNYPNPFNPITQIEFSIPKSNVFVQLTVYDVNGKEITQLINQQLNAGTYKVDFKADNFASGIYFYILETNEFTQTKRMVLVK